MVRFDDLKFSEKTDKKARFDKLAEEIDAAVSGDSSIAEDVAELKGTVGDEETEGTLLYRIKALETAAGNTQQGE